MTSRKKPILKQLRSRKVDKRVEGTIPHTYLHGVGRSEPLDVLQAANQVLLGHSNLPTKLSIFVVRRLDPATGWDKLSVFRVMAESINAPEMIGRRARAHQFGADTVR